MRKAARKFNQAGAALRRSVSRAGDAGTSPRSPRTGTLRIVLGLAVAVALLWVLSDLILLIFAAILLAVLLRGVARLLTRFSHLPVGASLAVVSILILVAAAAFGYFAGPRFVTEGQQLIQDIEQYARQFQQHYAGTFWGEIIQRAVSSRSGISIGPLAPRLLTVTFGTAGGVLLLIVTALYLAASPELYMHGALLLLPLAHRGRGRDILRQLCQVLRYWMLGQLIDMAAVGVLATVGLILLGIPLPLALGLLAGVLTFIPYLGAVLAGIPAVIVASTVSLASILWVILLYTACHVLEGYLIAPLISRRMVNLPPAVTLLSMVVLGELYGFLGILVATPLTAAVIVMVREIYVRDVLKDANVESWRT